MYLIGSNVQEWTQRGRNLLEELPEAVLQDPKEGDDIIELTRSYLECKRDLDARTDEWAELSDM